MSVCNCKRSNCFEIQFLFESCVSESMSSHLLTRLTDSSPFCITPWTRQLCESTHRSESECECSHGEGKNADAIALFDSLSRVASCMMMVTVKYAVKEANLEGFHPLFARFIFCDSDILLLKGGILRLNTVVFVMHH